MQLAHGGAAQRVAEAAPNGLAVRLDLLDAGVRRVREPDVVVRADQEPRSAGGRVVDCLAEPGIDKLDEGADDVAGRAELSQLARLPDLPQHVLEQVALGVGVHLFEVQVVHVADDLREHGRLVDHQSRVRHKVRHALSRDPGVEGEDLLPHPRHEPLTIERVCPVGPTQRLAADRLGTLFASVTRIPHRPFAHERAGVRLCAGTACSTDARRIRRLEHVEVDQEAQLLGVLGRIWVAPANR